MLLLSLLVGCPAPEDAPDDDTADTADTDTDDTGADPCDYDAPVETPLAWDEVGAGGVSAADLLSFGIGTFTAPLAWDDATTAALTLEVAAIDATESTHGPVERCVFLLEGHVAWTVVTDDARLDLAAEALWPLEEPSAGQSVGAVVLDMPLDPATVGFAQLDPGSSMWIRVLLEDDGTLRSVRVEEAWAVDADTTRYCVRASLDAASLECRDLDDTTGAE